MRTKQKWALTLLTALSAMSCGDSQPVDPYQSFIDGTAFDARFKPRNGCGARDSKTGALNTALCYQEVKAWFNGEERPFYNLGLIAKSSLPEATLAADSVKAIAYDFPEGCKPGKEYNQRTDAYREDTQYSVFDTLPLAVTGNNAPLVLPFVRVKNWAGVSQYTCNAIKNDQSLKDGVFGGSPDDSDTLSLRAVVDLTYLPVTPSPAANPVVTSWGWYKGLLLAYFDGGPVPVADNGNVKTMDGVWIKPTTSGAQPTDPDARLLFQARPGEADWSPVVRLREAAAASVPPNPTTLCYAEPCPEGTVIMSQVNTYTGVLFLAPKPQQ
ncbi:hypothetical protein [Cystobacter fuscus]|uniref:hypothetical protein n=1 Tax=Cystobacter fuscus TaxID=43 RepID=UPI002B2BCCE4|nr:hypothetical protein F0U63_47100 [Cystobacter fuscus]